MAVIQTSIFDNLDPSLSFMVFSNFWKTFGNDHLSSIFSALAIQYSEDISQSRLPKSLDPNDFSILTETIALQVNIHL